jgi:hypothetical protein
VKGTSVLVILVLSVVAMATILPGFAYAQDGSTIATPRFFRWYPDYGAALLIIFASIFGTLVVVFTSVGGVLPGTAGRVRVDAEEARYALWARKLDVLINSENVSPQAIEAIGKQLNDLRDDIRADRRNQFALGAVLYVVLGAIVALALAPDLFTAVAISSGWTSFLGAFGLKTDFAERKEQKTNAIKALELARDEPPPAQLEEQVAIAKAL